MKTIVSLALAGLMSISALLPALAAQEAESVSIHESSGISESMAQDESSVSSSGSLADGSAASSSNSTADESTAPESGSNAEDGSDSVPQPESDSMPVESDGCALPGFVDSKNEEKTERNAGYLVVSHSGGGMLRQGTRKGIRRTPANRGMRAHWVVKGLDISEDVCHGMCP